MRFKRTALTGEGIDDQKLRRTPQKFIEIMLKERITRKDQTRLTGRSQRSSQNDQRCEQITLRLDKPKRIHHKLVQKGISSINWHPPNHLIQKPQNTIGY